MVPKKVRGARLIFSPSGRGILRTLSFRVGSFASFPLVAGRWERKGGLISCLLQRAFDGSSVILCCRSDPGKCCTTSVMPGGGSNEAMVKKYPRRRQEEAVGLAGRRRGEQAPKDGPAQTGVAGRKCARWLLPGPWVVLGNSYFSGRNVRRTIRCFLPESGDGGTAVPLARGIHRQNHPSAAGFRPPRRPAPHAGLHIGSSPRAERAVLSRGIPPECRDNFHVPFPGVADDPFRRNLYVARPIVPLTVRPGFHTNYT